jgi:hypothetical protein
MSMVQGTHHTDDDMSMVLVCGTRPADGNASTVYNTRGTGASLSLGYQYTVQRTEANKSSGSTHTPGGVRFLGSTTGRTYAASVRRLCPATDEKINIRSERHGSRLSIQRYGKHTEDATSRSTLYNNTQVDQYEDST